jgi:acyl dehydratase
MRIREYKILRITHIRVNEDKKTYPRVEKFAQVEVDMKVFFTDTNQAAEVNFNFTFIKEGGRWYKG